MGAGLGTWALAGAPRRPGRRCVRSLHAHKHTRVSRDRPPGIISNPTTRQERARARRLFAEAEILYRLSHLARQHPGVVRPEMVNNSHFYLCMQTNIRHNLPISFVGVNMNHMKQTR